MLIRNLKVKNFTNFPGTMLQLMVQGPEASGICPFLHCFPSYLKVNEYKNVNFEGREKTIRVNAVIERSLERLIFYNTKKQNKMLCIFP